MAPWKTWPGLSKRGATAREFLSRLIVCSTALRRLCLLSKPVGRPPLLPRRLRVALALRLRDHVLDLASSQVAPIAA